LAPLPSKKKKPSAADQARKKAKRATLSRTKAFRESNQFSKSKGKVKAISLSPVRSNSRSPASEELQLPDSLPTELENSSTVQTFMADPVDDVVGPQVVAN
jgi:hypothetical protein